MKSPQECILQWKDRVEHWARTKPEIAEVWFFGSRVLGTARLDSDLDVAIVLAIDEAAEDCFTEVMQIWPESRPAWEKELGEIIDVRVQLECGNPCASPGIVAPAIADHGLKVYPPEIPKRQQASPRSR